ncbi:MAG: hypothetical protein M1834_000254 [Cirrosporium novae-zelandiae]|nr:MAG: hypothetical protein M1834_000254 [Cirrosporium novae-zelandiae]
MEQNPQGSGQQQQQQQRQQPVYDLGNGGHFGIWANVNQGLSGNYRDILTTYWQQMINHLEGDNHDYKQHQLPLARIKKVMKADPEVKMISAEAPILFAKGCDIFITELTMRAWIHAEENKRRTLQRSDIANALARSDMFDFLIDIVPREEASSHAKRSGGQSHTSQAAASAPTQGQLPQQPPPQPPQQHHMPPPDYSHLGQPMHPEQEYRQPQAMYTQAVQSDPTGYGQPQQPQMSFDGMYGYTMPPQGMYQVGQRPQDPSAAQDPTHHYQRHDGGDVDADAEGERDYEVG